MSKPWEEDGYPDLEGRVAALERLTSDGWRTRCLTAEKKGQEYLAEITMLRDRLRELENYKSWSDNPGTEGIR